MKPCALTQSRARCVPTATRRPCPLRPAPVSAVAVTASQLLPRWRTRFVVPSATPIAGGDREWLSRRRRRLLTGQSWYRWPKEQRTPLLYHALARGKSTFNRATKGFVDTALSGPDPTATRRVAGHRQFHLQDLLLTRWHRFFFRRAALCRARCLLRSVAAPPHDSAPSWSMVVGLPPSCGNSTPSHELVLSHLAIVTSIAGRAHRDGARRTGPAGTWQPRKRRSARVSGRTYMFRHFGLAR